MIHRGAQPRARVVQGVGTLSTLSEYAETRASRCQKCIAVHNTFQDNKKKRWQHKEFDMIK